MRGCLMLLPLTLLLVCWCVQGTVITSSLTATGREYVCPQEQPTYVCNGTGNVIDVYAPPAVPLVTAVSFVRDNDQEGLATRSGPLFVTLISTGEPFMVVNIQVLDSTAVTRIVCDLQSEMAQVMHRISGPPLDVNSQRISQASSNKDNSNEIAVNVNWTITDGDYDPSHHTVQLFQNNTEIRSISVSSASEKLEAFFVVIVESDVELYARITTVSKCNRTSDGVHTNLLLFSNRGTTWCCSVLLVLISTIITLIEI